MIRPLKKWLVAAGALTVPAALTTLLLNAPQVQSSDHADTTENVNRLGADMTDVFIFPNPADASRVVLVMNVRGLIPAGQAGNFSFDPDVLYQFKIDNSSPLDYQEDLVIQARFGAAGPNQSVEISGPLRPADFGAVNRQLTPFSVTGRKGTAFSPTAGMQVFAGPRKDPFFFDLERFCQILPDRCVPAGLATAPADPNQAQATTWRAPGQDFLANLNCLSIVVELPKARIARSVSGATQLGKIGLWGTTSVRN